MAEQWIQTAEDHFKRGDGIHFAIALRPQDLFIGGIGLSIDRQNEVAELGYWIGKPYWNQGYCTEAAQATLRYGLEVLGLNRIQARHFASNPASGRVMQKSGMKYEGYLRQATRKWGRAEDWEVYSILKGEIRQDLAYRRPPG
jgi:RimJ/RimL family protein N-acetyltransferase